MLMLFLISFIIVHLMSMAGSVEPTTIKSPYKLLVDGRSSLTSYSKTFVVVNTQSPSLTWVLRSKQSAYEIEVIYDNNKTWTTGLVVTNNTLSATYQGKKLQADEEVQWRVRVWKEIHGGDQTTGNIPSAWSGKQTFKMSRKEADWAGIWLTANSTDSGGYSESKNNKCSTSPYGNHPNPIFKKKFKTENKEVKRARLYIAGLGYYRTMLNGITVPGDTFLDPEWTSFAKRIAYNTLDVTEWINKPHTSHTLKISLGNGWWNLLPLKMWGKRDLRNDLATGPPMFRLDLVIEYYDGTKKIVSSNKGNDEEDGKWMLSPGPYSNNNIYLGSVYDQRREKEVWSETGVMVVEQHILSALGVLEASRLPPIRAFEHLSGKIISPYRNNGDDDKDDDAIVYDMGRNFAGTINVTFQGPLPMNTSIEFLYGEVLWGNGSVNGLTSVAGQIKHPGEGGDCAPNIAYQKDIFITKGLRENETYSHVPRFTWHGFRYIAVSLSTTSNNNKNNEKINLRSAIQSILGIALRTDINVHGSFSVPRSNDKKENKHILEKIFNLAYNTHSSNMMSVQSDCPHRERFGYGGDLLATAETGMHIFNMVSFYRKRILDYNDAQRNDGGFTETSPYVGIYDNGVDKNGSGPIGWATVQPVLQTWMWDYYSDSSSLKSSYNSTKKWMNMLSNHVDESLIENGLSDWMNVEPNGNVHRLTGHVFQWMNYHAWSKINRVLGYKDIAELAEEDARRVRNRMNQLFLQTNGTFTDTKTFNLSQCSQSMPLYYDLVPKDAVPAVKSMLNLSLYELGNGVPQSAVGMFCILPLLSSIPLNTAYNMMTREDYPSYGYMLKMNATTLWESWFYSNNTYSHNHPMFSSVVVWMFRYLGGINQASYSVGWSHIILRPRCPCETPSLPGVNISLNTVRGKIVSNWTRYYNKNGDTFTWSFSIPYGSIGFVDIVGKEVYQVQAGEYILKNINICSVERAEIKNQHKDTRSKI